MTIYEPNPDVRPTGAEAGEFEGPAEPNPPNPPGASGRVRTHADDREPAEADRETTERAEADAEARAQESDNGEW